MSVTIINSGLRQEKGITYSEITDSSADWDDVTDGAYFYDIATDLPYYKSSAGLILSLFSEANTIYTADGVLTGNRTVDLEDFILTFDGNGAGSIATNFNGRTAFTSNKTTPLQNIIEVQDSSNNRIFEVREGSNVLINAQGSTGSSALSIYDGSNAKIIDFSDNGRVNFSSLPTNAAGLSAGDLWDDGGIVRIGTTALADDDSLYTIDSTIGTSRVATLTDNLTFQGGNIFTTINSSSTDESDIESYPLTLRNTELRANNLVGMLFQDNSTDDQARIYTKFGTKNSLNFDVKDSTFQNLLKLEGSNVNMSNLPTASTGLGAGDLWDDNGVVRVGTSGTGASSIYTADGTLIGDRIVDLDGNNLQFSNINSIGGLKFNGTSNNGIGLKLANGSNAFDFVVAGSSNTLIGTGSLGLLVGGAWAIQVNQAGQVSIGENFEPISGYDLSVDNAYFNTEITVKSPAGVMQFNGYRSQAAVPNTATFPNDKDLGIHENTSTGVISLAYNDGGTILSIPLDLPGSGGSIYSADGTIGTGRVATLTDTLNFSEGTFNLLGLDKDKKVAYISGDSSFASQTTYVDNALNFKFDSSTGTGQLWAITSSSGSGKLNVKGSEVLIENIKTNDNLIVSGNSNSAGIQRAIEMPFGTTGTWKGVNLLSTQVGGGGADFEMQVSPGGLGGTYETALKIAKDKTVSIEGDTLISKQLELSSTEDGLLMNRLTTVQRDAISTPDTHLLIFNTDTERIERFDGTNWVAETGGGDSIYTADGTLTGNRTVDLDGNSLSFNSTNGTNSLLSLSDNVFGEISNTIGGIFLDWNETSRLYLGNNIINNKTVNFTVSNYDGTQTSLNISPNASGNLTINNSVGSVFKWGNSELQMAGSFTKISRNGTTKIHLNNNSTIIGSGATSPIGSETVSLQGSTLIKGTGINGDSLLSLYDNAGTPNKLWDFLDDGEVISETGALSIGVTSNVYNSQLHVKGVTTLQADSANGYIGGWAKLDGANISAVYGNGDVVFGGFVPLGSESISLQGETAVYGVGNSGGSALAIYNGNTPAVKLWDFLDNGDLTGSKSKVKLTAQNATTNSDADYILKLRKSDDTADLLFVGNGGEVRLGVGATDNGTGDKSTHIMWGADVATMAGSGNYAILMGQVVSANYSGNDVIGLGRTITLNNQRQIALGQGITFTGEGTFGMGRTLTSTAGDNNIIGAAISSTGRYSNLMGKYLESTSTGASIIGNGDTLTGAKLVNNTANSLALGWNSATPQHLIKSTGAEFGGKTDLTSTSDGFLINRVTTIQRNSIVAPDTHLMVFDIDLNSLQRYNGTAWVSVAAGYGIVQLTQEGEGGNPVFYSDMQSALDASNLIGGDCTIKLHDNLNITSTISTNATSSIGNLTIDLNGFTIQNDVADSLTMFYFRFHNNRILNIINGSIIKSTGTGKCIDLVTGVGTLIMSNCFVYSESGTALTIQAGIVPINNFDLGGSTFESNTNMGVLSSNGTVILTNFNAVSTNGTALRLNSGSATFFTSKAKGIGLAVYLRSGALLVSDFTADSNSGNALNTEGTNTLIKNFSAISVSGYAVFSSATPYKIENFYAKTTSGAYAVNAPFDTVLINGTIISDTTPAGYLSSSKRAENVIFITNSGYQACRNRATTEFINCIFRNNGGGQGVAYSSEQTSFSILKRCSFISEKTSGATGHGARISIAASVVKFLNCDFSVLDSTANCVHGTVAMNAEVSNSNFSGSTTPINTNITLNYLQSDAYGNVTT